MNETQRYNEPKKLWDIIKDMNISQKKKDVAADIIASIEAYAKVIDTLDTIYKRATPLITAIDNYYSAEKRIFLNTQKHIHHTLLTQKDINNRMQHIQSVLDDFENKYTRIKIHLLSTIKKLPSPEDQEEQEIKAHYFYELFMTIYCDIDDIIVWYSKLLAQVPKK